MSHGRSIPREIVDCPRVEQSQRDQDSDPVPVLMNNSVSLSSEHSEPPYMGSRSLDLDFQSTVFQSKTMSVYRHTQYSAQ